MMAHVPCNSLKRWHPTEATPETQGMMPAAPTSLGPIAPNVDLIASLVEKGEVGQANS